MYGFSANACVVDLHITTGIIKRKRETIEPIVERLRGKATFYVCYTNEAGRLYGVLDKRLGEADYMAGDYSIADMATYPWTRSIDRQGVDPTDYPNVVRWQKRLEGRPAVARGCAVLSDRQRSADMTDEERNILFGTAQYERR